LCIVFFYYIVHFNYFVHFFLPGFPILWLQRIFCINHAPKQIWQRYTTSHSSNRLACCQQRPCHSTTANYTNKIFESKNKDTSLLLEEHFFDTVVVCKKKIGPQFEDLPPKVVEFFFCRFNIGGIFCYNKVCQKKLILTTFVVQMNSFGFFVGLISVAFFVIIKFVGRS
jgi:hypothetical protein